jgi:hypothetical protein
MSQIETAREPPQGLLDGVHLAPAHRPRNIKHANAKRAGRLRLWRDRLLRWLSLDGLPLRQPLLGARGRGLRYRQQRR